MTSLIEQMTSRIEASKKALIRGPTAIRRYMAELPEPLQGYEPARSWSDGTIEAWMAIREEMPGGVVILAPDRWLQVFEDVLRTTGPTPWNDPFKRQDMAILFAGKLVAPDLKALKPRPLPTTYSARIGRLRLISGLQALQLGIPNKSLRGHWAINQDCGYVDVRRLKRMKRRAKAA